MEISPPVVQTELHDYNGPDGRKMGMPVDAFVDEAYKGLVEGSDQIVIGAVGPQERFDGIVNQRRAAFEDLAKFIQGH